MDRKELIDALTGLNKTPMVNGEPEVKIKVGLMNVGIDAMIYDINKNVIVLEMDYTLKGTRYEE